MYKSLESFLIFLSSIKKLLILFFVGYTLIVITRLPQLLSPSFMLDGDECILGLMAKHMAEGKETPVFLYGQNYGFSLIEGRCAALGFRLIGVSAVTLKLAMLFLWTIGCLFLFPFWE